MRFIKLTGYLTAYLLALIIVQGCAVTGTPSDPVRKGVAVNNGQNAGASSADVEVSAHVQQNVQSGLSMVAEDFVHALQQIPSHAPSATTIQIPRSDSADSITQSFKAAFEAGGYGVRIVDVVADNNVFQYRLDDESYDDAAGRHRFEIAVGAVEMRRTYGGLLINNVHPVTPLYVRGADATKVILNDAAFASTSPNSGTTSGIPLVDISTSIATSEAPTEDSPIAQTSETFVAATTDEPLEVVFGAGSFALPLVALSEVQNVFELGTSNYVDVLTELDIVAQQILTFPNDSLRLGNLNKQLVENMVGCWAGDSEGNTLPRRGVVLTLNRKS